MITIRETKKIHTDKIERSLSKALSFMREKYPDVNFHVDYIFGGGSRSRYFRNDNSGNFNGKYKTPTVFISCRTRWITYKKASLKVYADFSVGVELQILLALIHELTHHAQYELGRLKGSEVETTKNELEYCEKYEPKTYKKLITIK